MSVFTGMPSWYFSMVSVLLLFPLLLFLKSHAPTLAKGIFVEAGLRQMIWAIPSVSRPYLSVPLSQTYLDAPHAMLPLEFLALLQPGDGGGRVASSCTVEAYHAGGWHSQQFHIHTVWLSLVRGP